MGGNQQTQWPYRSAYPISWWSKDCMTAPYRHTGVVDVGTSCLPETPTAYASPCQQLQPCKQARIHMGHSSQVCQ